MIKCKHVKVRYKASNKNALNDINIDFMQGKITAIVGHNGAGKSTLIKAITGLIDSEGEISYAFDKMRISKHIRVQMQSSQFEKGIKVVDIIKLYLAMTDSNESCDELLNQFNLMQYKKTMIERLSGGEKQRLAILLAVIGEAKVIIFDEITTGLDSVARRQVWDLIKQIQQNRNLTIILTSHFLEEVVYLADEVVVMSEGTVLEWGTVDKIIHQTFGNKREARCLTDSSFNWAQITFPYRCNNNAIYVEYTSDTETEVYNQLKKCGGFDLELRQYSFEDAFLKIAGYSLNNKGEAHYE